MSLWGPGEPVTPAKGLLLCGCEEPVMEQTEPVLETVVSATVPADGNTDDVTCKGT